MGSEGVDLSARYGVSPSMDGHSDFINLSVSKPRRKPRPPLTLRPTPNIRELPHCTLLTLCLQPSLRTRYVLRGLLNRWKHQALVPRLARLRQCRARMLRRVALQRWSDRAPAESPSLTKSSRLRHMRLRAHMRLWLSAARAVARLLELEQRAERRCAIAVLQRWRQAGARRREAAAAARRAERLVLFRRWRRHAGLLLASPRHALLRSQRRPARPASHPPPSRPRRPPPPPQQPRQPPPPPPPPQQPQPQQHQSPPPPPPPPPPQQQPDDPLSASDHEMLAELELDELERLMEAERVEAERVEAERVEEAERVASIGDVWRILKPRA